MLVWIQTRPEQAISPEASAGTVVSGWAEPLCGGPEARLLLWRACAWRLLRHVYQCADGPQ